jgi:hypothetical protein
MAVLPGEETPDAKSLFPLKKLFRRRYEFRQENKRAATQVARNKIFCW